MKIAFYAPLKAPDHPVPSGDRQMANLLMAALKRGGHEPCVVSRLRTYMADPSAHALDSLQLRSREEASRIAEQWLARGAADLWFTYHPYYKAPDLIGPELSQRFSIPYITCEASYAGKRDTDEWRDLQVLLKEALGKAALNIYFTERDRDGLVRIVDEQRLAELKPFIDTTKRRPGRARGSRGPAELITVAMMRKGDKLDSYRMLAAALGLLLDLQWQLTIIGGGPLELVVKALFQHLPQDRIKWMGELSSEEVAARLSASDVYLWPGFGEAYGMAYLEAQAAGLPVIAQNTAGVPSVVRDGETGILVSPGNIEQFADAVRKCILDPDEVRRLGGQARDFICRERSLDRAADRLNMLLLRIGAAAGR